MAAFTIPSIFTAVDKLTGPLRAMTANVQGFANSAQSALARADRGFRKLSGGLISETGKQFLSFASTAAVAAAIVGGASFSVKSLQDYESSLASFRTIVSDLNDNEFALYRDQINQVAKDTKRSSIEVANSFGMIAGLNADFAKTADGLAAVSNASIVLAKASGMELGASAESLVGIMNQFSMSASEAEKTINVLAAGQAVGAANISQTAEAFKNFGSTASNANITLEESVALIQTLGKFSITGAEAGTKLRGAVSKLQEANVGYASGVFNVNDALAEAKAKIDKLTTAKEKDEAISKMFGLENKNAGLILLNNIQTYKDYTTGVTGTSEASKAAAINSATLSTKIDELKAAWVNMLTSSDKASSALNSAKNIAGFLADNLDTIVSVGSKVLLFFGLWKAALIIGEGLLWGYNIALAFQGFLSGKASIAIGKNAVALGVYNGLTWIANAATWAWTAATTAWAFAMSVGLLPLTLIILAIGVLIAIIYSVIQHTKGWGEQWANITDWMGAKFEVWKQGLLLGFNLIAYAFQAVVNTMVTAWQWGQNLIGNISDEQFAKNKAMMKQEQQMRAANIADNFKSLMAANAKAENTDLKWMLAWKTPEDIAAEEATKEAVNPKLSEQEAMVQRMEKTSTSNVNVNFNDPGGMVKNIQQDNGLIPIKLSSTSTWGQ